jgi:hypothetical protein
VLGLEQWPTRLLCETIMIMFFVPRGVGYGILSKESVRSVWVMYSKKESSAWRNGDSPFHNMTDSNKSK